MVVLEKSEIHNKIGEMEFMKKFLQKHSRIALAGVVGASLFATTQFASASDDNVGYSFTIGPNYSNSYSSARYRETSSNANPWKVKFAYSAEGSGTFTTFWLDKSGTRVSVAPVVKQGTTEYNGTYDGAQKSNVRLGAENNNFNSSSYKVSGYWDEETW